MGTGQGSAVRALGQACLWAPASLLSFLLPCEDSASSLFPLSSPGLDLGTRYDLPGFLPPFSSPLPFGQLLRAPLSSLSSHPQLRVITPLALSPSPKPFHCLRQRPFLHPSLGSRLFFSMQSAKTPLPKFSLPFSLHLSPSIFTSPICCIYILSTLMP